MTDSTAAGFDSPTERRRDARHDRHCDALCTEIFQFFAAAAGLERIAARKTHNLVTGLGGLCEKTIDFALADGGNALTPADEFQFGIAAHTIENIGTDP